MVGQGKKWYQFRKTERRQGTLLSPFGGSSPEGVKKRRQLWSDLQKEYPEAIISLFFFLGCRGHHLYKKAVAGDCYAAVVLLSVMEELNREK
ncbi:TPA_asm: hypothetical protein G4B90_004894 [Salmonella enterica subsp. enterica serovar Java]|uniref:Uncharacterized protein n=1 Tax=Salmonella enterica subsp. enterica serovar Java TaxID=224729 RepID=A0A732Y884_SALEB|nr:hypothetical protein [Salmonella enterica subsp. enterica serovar Java]HAE5389414.1 hypothetical protein [Salmonella enterica subsp. enterica serovar Java]